MQFPPSCSKITSNTGVVVAEARNSCVDSRIRGWRVTRPVLCACLEIQWGKKGHTHAASLKKRNGVRSVSGFLFVHELHGGILNS